MSCRGIVGAHFMWGWEAGRLVICLNQCSDIAAMPWEPGWGTGYLVQPIQLTIISQGATIIGALTLVTVWMLMLLSSKESVLGKHKKIVKVTHSNWMGRRFYGWYLLSVNQDIIVECKWNRFVARSRMTFPH